MGIVGAGAARRLRQRRQPAAGARRGAAARAVGAARARRLARPPGPAAADREPAARRAGRDRRPRGRGVGLALPGGPDRPRRRVRVALALPLDWRLLGFLAGALDRRPRSASAWCRPGGRGALDAADAVSHASHGRVTRRGAVSGPAGRRPDRAVARARRRRRPLRPHVLGAGDARHRLRARTTCTSRSSASAATPGAQRGRGSTRELQQAAPRVPGVQAAAVSMIEPLSGMGWNGRASTCPASAPAPAASAMTYLQRGHARLVRDLRHAARSPGATSRPATTPAPPVAIVERGVRPALLRRRAAVGRRVRDGDRPRRDGRGRDRRRRRRTPPIAALREAFPPTLYRPLAQIDGAAAVPQPHGADGAGRRAGLQPALTRAIRGVDPTLTLTYRSDGRPDARPAHRGPRRSRCCPASSARWRCSWRRSGSTASRRTASPSAAARSASA